MVYMLWPTIRAEMFVSTFSIWKARAANIWNVRVSAMVKDEEQVKCLLRNTPMVMATPGNTSLPKALYQMCNDTVILSKAKDDDIVCVPQDDLFPPQQWDKIILDEFKDFDGAICFNDGIQQYPVPVCTFPCLTVAALKKLNRIIFHPVYRHLYCDQEYFLNCKELGIMKDLRQTNLTLFEHRHHCIKARPADAIDEKISNNEGIDRNMFKARMTLPIAERLTV
jgi:hypothetical protein